MGMSDVHTARVLHTLEHSLAHTEYFFACVLLLQIRYIKSEREREEERGKSLTRLLLQWLSLHMLFHALLNARHLICVLSNSIHVDDGCNTWI